ncbi:MAG: tyrosine-type recombinase/integrase, partial [Gammaproteobacteria bacterium]
MPFANRCDARSKRFRIALQRFFDSGIVASGLEANAPESFREGTGRKTSYSQAAFRDQGSRLVRRTTASSTGRGLPACGPELTIHSFRAGFATALHRATGDVLLVSRSLGHRDLRPTMRYVQWLQPELRKAIDRAFTRLLI